MKIFINPGHHIGVDPGAVNKTVGVTEAEVVASIGKLVSGYLSDLGHEVKVLQSDNLEGENPKYPNVIRTANQWEPDMFISLHCNAAGSRQANGTECWVYSRWSAAETMAGRIQAALVKNLKTYDRGVKVQPRFIVLSLTNCPAVLVELAFISNEIEARMLKEQQDKIARALVEGIMDYITLYSRR